MPVVANDQFFTVSVPRADGETGQAGYALNVTSCNDQPTTLGDAVDTVLVSASDGIDELIALDPGATWDAGTGTVTGSAFVVSPRIVPIVLFDPSELAAQGNPPTTTFSLHVRNIVGFFVEAWTGELVVE